MGLPIPRSLDELTPAWLTSALTESSILKNARIQHIDFEVLGTGSGFMGEIFRLKLKQWILKLLFLNPKAPIRARFIPKTLRQIDWLTLNHHRS